MNADSYQPETLLTNHREVNGLVSSQRCSWEVRLGRMTQPLQLMLSLRLGHRRPGAAASGPGCPSELTAELQGSAFVRKWTNATSLPKAPLIVPVMRSSQLLTVRFSTGDSVPSASCGRIELTIAVAKKGFCGRHMLLHRGRCLFISDSELRLGVCSRERFNSTAVSDLAVKGNLTADTRCTALQADPEGRAALHSCSCRAKMLSLLSFSETPVGSESGKVRTKNCWLHVHHLRVCGANSIHRTPPISRTTGKSGQKLIVAFLIALYITFAISNDDRTNAHPFIRPLNLTRPVRVAVFRCNKIIQWTQVAQTVSSSLCVIGNFSTTGAAQESFTRRNQSISSQVDCASISAEPDDSEKLKLSFIDCDQPQHLLLSFLIEPINQDLQHNSNCLESTITGCKDLSMHIKLI
uniref:CUB domain-containing protein n=1 Tax=Macrostomum lignano TaxID=282301 RepID=A0A1I8IA47_9PLAT